MSLYFDDELTKLCIITPLFVKKDKRIEIGTSKNALLSVQTFIKRDAYEYYLKQYNNNKIITNRITWSSKQKPEWKTTTNYPRVTTDFKRGRIVIYTYSHTSQCRFLFRTATPVIYISSEPVFNTFSEFYL